jgi:hypothetical protein
VVPNQSEENIMANPKITTLDQTISNGRQATTAVSILTIGTFKVRLTVKSDSYDFQCHAKAEVFNFDTLSWNHLYSIPFAQMKTPVGLVYRPNGVNKGFYSSDLGTLTDMAIKILF